MNATTPKPLTDADFPDFIRWMETVPQSGTAVERKVTRCCGCPVARYLHAMGYGDDVSCSASSYGNSTLAIEPEMPPRFSRFIREFDSQFPAMTAKWSDALRIARSIQ